MTSVSKIIILRDFNKVAIYKTGFLYVLICVWNITRNGPEKRLNGKSTLQCPKDGKSQKIVKSVFFSRQF